MSSLDDVLSATGQVPDISADALRTGQSALAAAFSTGRPAQAVKAATADGADGAGQAAAGARLADRRPGESAHRHRDGSSGSGRRLVIATSGPARTSPGAPPASSMAPAPATLTAASVLNRAARPRGHALLVGVGGSGKQSLTKLAAYAARYRLFTINLTRHYSENDFKEDLKALYTSLATGKDPHTGQSHAGPPSSQASTASASGSMIVSTPSPIVFLFTDAHVKDEGFLELINNMLTSGMVPALFTDEEKQPFIDSVRGEVKSLGMIVNAQNCWNHFVSKCADNIHLVLCFSPAGDSLRRRCRSFPGLVNNTVIDWFFPWPQAALQAVAEKFIAAEASIEAEDRSKIVSHMVKVHSSVIDYSAKFKAELRRQNSVTPKNFLDYIHAYRAQLSSAREENVRQYNRLDGGLTKLIDAGEAVDKYRH